MSKFDIEAIGAASSFGDIDALASYVARNTDAPIKKISRASGLDKDQVEALLTNRQFRERLTEVLTYSELTPDKERAVLRRMLDVTLDPSTDFRDFREAATWIYRQGGMLRAEKAQVDVGGTVRVAFTLDPEATHLPGAEARYVPPDPFAGIVGLPGTESEVEEQAEDVEFYPVPAEAGEDGEEGSESEETDWLDGDEQ